MVFGVIFGTGWVLIVGFACVVTTADAVWTFKRNLRADAYFSATGPLRWWGARRPKEDAITYGRVAHAARPFLSIGKVRLDFEKKGAYPLAGNREVTVDYLPHGRLLLEVRDASGRVLYRAPSYHPDAE